MELITTRFATIAELVDFQMITGQCRAVVNPAECTLTGAFSEAELELAVNGYHAQTLTGMQQSRNHGTSPACAPMR